MASPFFRSILNPSQTFGMEDFRYLQGVNSSSSSSGFQFGHVANLIGSIGSVLSRDFQKSYEDSALDMSGSALTSKAMRQSKQQTNQAISIVSQILMSVLSLVLL